MDNHSGHENPRQGVDKERADLSQREWEELSAPSESHCGPEFPTDSMRLMEDTRKRKAQEGDLPDHHVQILPSWLGSVSGDDRQQSVSMQLPPIPMPFPGEDVCGHTSRWYSMPDDSVQETMSAEPRKINDTEYTTDTVEKNNSTMFVDMTRDHSKTKYSPNHGWGLISTKRAASPYTASSQKRRKNDYSATAENKVDEGASSKQCSRLDCDGDGENDDFGVKTVLFGIYDLCLEKPDLDNDPAFWLTAKLKDELEQEDSVPTSMSRDIPGEFEIEEAPGRTN